MKIGSAAATALSREQRETRRKTVRGTWVQIVFLARLTYIGDSGEAFAMWDHRTPAAPGVAQQ